MNSVSRRKTFACFLLFGFALIHCMNSVLAQSRSAFSKGPHVERSLCWGKFSIHLKTQPSAEGEGRFASIVVWHDSWESPRLRLCLAFPKHVAGSAELIDAKFSSKLNVASCVLRADLDGERTSVVYTFKSTPNGNFADVLVIGSEVFDLDQGRLFELTGGQRRFHVQQTRVAQNAGFVKDMTSVLQQDLAELKRVDK